ncbi:MAG: PrsW family intramembrane metalloprotease [Methanobacteriota archaeon]|nr:MAG: PrsW family intramembrane metalloprotease [Euryarchaeota archaeon]
MADLASSPYFLLILFIAAFALPLLYLIWIRNSPRYGREPWPTVLKTFAWGAVFSVIIAIILSILFILVLSSSQSLNDFFARRFQDPSTAIGALVVAPIVEEAAKGVGATAGRPQTQSSTDGLVYGAAAGLGFSATENLVYALAALLVPGVGPSGSLVVVAVRSFSSTFLHASSTAVMGYGLAKSWLSGRPWAVFPFYVVAVAMHAAFNLFSTLADDRATANDAAGSAIAFLAAVSLAVVAISVVRLKLVSRRSPTSR